MWVSSCVTAQTLTRHPVFAPEGVEEDVDEALDPPHGPAVLLRLAPTPEAVLVVENAERHQQSLKRDETDRDAELHVGVDVDGWPVERRRRPRQAEREIGAERAPRELGDERHLEGEHELLEVLGVGGGEDPVPA